MDRKTIDGQPRYLFHADELYGMASDAAPRGMAIEGTDTDGDAFRLEIDLLQLADLLGGVIDCLEVDGRPTASVAWDPERDVIDVQKGPNGRPS